MTTNPERLLGPMALGAALLALVVVSLGAYTRLSDSGLGCPDWPGCYGHLTVPRSAAALASAETAFPERPVEPAKAWVEMVHRYFAGTLGLVIAAIATLAWRRRRAMGPSPALPTALLGLVVFQALLGMWTVTLLLKPVVVLAHLLGGFTTLLLLWWLALRNTALIPARPGEGWLRVWTLVALVVVYLQVSLGGWTAANYAALACVDFPTCHGQWWPAMDFAEAFVLWRGLGIDYEYGVLDHPARTAIHVTHRLGAVLTAVVVGGLAVAALARAAAPVARRVGGVLAVVLLAQVGLGVANVMYSLPLPVAVAHNAGGALLLLTLATLLHTLNPRRTTPGGMS